MISTTGESPRVSAVIVNWNGAHHLRVCLPSLRAQTFQPLEIVVVDNGSSDDSGQVAREFGARWLPLQTNVGLAPALNHGAKAALGEMLLFVNNDMRFHESFVSALAKPLQSSETIFATDAMQFNWDGTEHVHVATRLSQKRNAGPHSSELVRGLHFYQQDEGHPVRVFMGSAACILVRRTLFEKLDGFDHRLPMGYEDVEICWRAWLRHWPTLFVPDAVCWHRVGASSRSPQGADLNFRGILTGRLLFSTKLLPLRYALRTWLVSGLALLRDAVGLRWPRAQARFQVLGHMARLTPRLLGEKRNLFRSANSTPARHLQSMLQLTRAEVRGFSGELAP